MRGLVLLVLVPNVVQSLKETFLSRESPFLSDLVSSPDRYASALGLPIDEIHRRQQDYQDATAALDDLLKDSSLTGEEKHELICRHRLTYRGHPFVCERCWSYLPVCICGELQERRRLPKNLEVVVWTHHKEWGLTSNTGCILRETVDPCSMLMKGLPEHDAQLSAILEDPTCFPVVLWPAESEARPSVSVENLRLQVGARRVVLIAVDGTWRNARKMVARMPSSVSRLDLGSEIVGEGESLLAPIRFRGHSSGEDDSRKVCTAEAVVGAMIAFGLAEVDGRYILDVAERKVDLIRRYRGHRSKNE